MVQPKIRILKDFWRCHSAQYIMSPESKHSFFSRVILMDRRHFLQSTAALTFATATHSAAHAQPPNEGLSGTNALTQQLNPTIQDAREVALNILKPSEKELQHGLEIHADSLVFDTYGFSPRAAIDGDKIKTLVEAGASQIEIKDRREQMTMTRYVTDPIEQRFGGHLRLSERGRRRTRSLAIDKATLQLHIRDRHAERLRRQSRPARRHCGRERRRPTLPVLYR